jgi:2'-5' RNA ligase
MTQPLSYSVTSLAPEIVNSKFHSAKKYFNLLYSQPMTKPEHFILKNLAHITLKRLFYLKDNISDDEMQEALDSIIFKPLPIEAHSSELFRTDKWGNVLVALVKKTPELQKLHDDLSEVIDTFAAEQDMNFERKTFNPHLTVFYNLPEEQIKEAFTYTQANILPIKYSLESFRFMKDVPGVRGERELLKEYFAKE